MLFLDELKLQVTKKLLREKFSFLGGGGKVFQLINQDKIITCTSPPFATPTETTDHTRTISGQYILVRETVGRFAV